MIQLFMSRSGSSVIVPLNLPASHGAMTEAYSQLEQANRTGKTEIVEIKSVIANLPSYLGGLDPDSRTQLAQLNLLSSIIAKMDSRERSIYAGALDGNSINDLNDMIRVAEQVSDYILIPNVNSDVTLGRYVAVAGQIQGDPRFPEAAWPYLDFAKIGAEYYAEHGGAYTHAGYVLLKQDAEPVREKAAKIRLDLSSSQAQASVSLPALKEELERVKKLLGIDCFAEAAITKVSFAVPNLNEYIDELIAKKESLIADLEIYKKSLIYEVVTGKRRVEDTNQMTIAILSPEIMRYRKALLMLRVLDLLGTGVRGRIQLQKCMFAAECLLNMPFHTQFIRYEHGPYDPDLPNIEEIINAKGWYTVLKGSPVSYQKGKQFEEGLREYMDTFSEIDLKLEKIVDFLRPMKTSQAERVATLLAAWNDFIIDGVSHPTDKEIIGEVVTNWTPNKANPQYSTWQDTLFKMREHRFVPKGSGVHTLQKEA